MRYNFLKQRWQEEGVTSVLLLEEVHEEAEPNQEDGIPDQDCSLLSGRVFNAGGFHCQ